MDKKIKKPDIQSLLREVEKWDAENKGGKQKIKYMRKQIEDLGGKEKKHFIPLKHRFLLKKHADKKKREKRADMISRGIKMKKKSKSKA